MEDYADVSSQIGNIYIAVRQGKHGMQDHWRAKHEPNSDHRTKMEYLWPDQGHSTSGSVLCRRSKSTLKGMRILVRYIVGLATASCIA